MDKKRQKQAGFTLVEIMAVVVILGILASFATIKVVQYLSRARITKAKVDMKQIMNAINLFHMDNKEYPESLDQLTEGTETYPEGILSAIPKDPWGNDYEYVSGTEHGYDLICYGRDGTEGGEGEDADINSWEIDRPEDEEGGIGSESEGG